MLKVNTQKFGKLTFLRLQGRIQIGQTQSLVTATLAQSDARAVVLDLACVTGVDAAGLGVLLELRHQTQARGIEFKLINVRELVARVFEITCLNTVFEISSPSAVWSQVSPALTVNPGTHL